MIRQPRSEATRRKIIDAAVDLFDEVGYAGTVLGDIIDRVDVTKGGLYHHFDSKESLALAIIDEAAGALGSSIRRVGESSLALESMIRGVFVLAELSATDKRVRTGLHLLHSFAQLNEAATGVYRDWLAEMVAQTRQAQEAGDLRADLDPHVVGEFLVSALVGVELISASLAGGADVVERVTKAWEILLPAIVSERSLPYFREFVARQSQRHRRSDSKTIDPVT